MIHYSKSGQGKNTIVLVHGFCENSTCFHKQVFFLKDHYTVITPDLPGFGQSNPESHISMESLADSIHEILLLEKTGPCIVLGHSMGGYVTLALAQKYPEMLKGFGLMHSTAKADNDERKQKRDQAIRVIEEKGVESYIINFIPPLFSPDFNQPETVNAMIEEGLKSPASGIIGALLAMKTRFDHTALLKETALPVFFAVGKHDQIIPETDMLQQASQCRVSQICYLEHSAHMGFMEEPDKFNESILAFASDSFSAS